MGTQTFPTSLGTNMEGQSSLARSFECSECALTREDRSCGKFVRARSPFVQFRAYRLSALLEHRSGLALASLEWAVTLGPTGSIMSDLQHEVA